MNTSVLDAFGPRRSTMSEACNSTWKSNTARGYHPLYFNVSAWIPAHWEMEGLNGGGKALSPGEETRRSRRNACMSCTVSSSRRSRGEVGAHLSIRLESIGLRSVCKPGCHLAMRIMLPFTKNPICCSCSVQTIRTSPVPLNSGWSATCLGRRNFGAPGMAGVIDGAEGGAGS